MWMLRRSCKLIRSEKSAQGGEKLTDFRHQIRWDAIGNDAMVKKYLRHLWSSNICGRDNPCKLSVAIGDYYHVLVTFLSLWIRPKTSLRLNYNSPVASESFK